MRKTLLTHHGEGILQILSSLQSWNSLKTHDPTASSQHLWAANNPWPTAWLLLSWVSPHWFPCSWHPGEGSPSCLGRKRPLWGRGTEARTQGWEPGQTPLGVDLKGKSRNSTCLYAFMLSCFSVVRFFVTLWTTAPQAPRSMGFSNGFLCPLPGNLPDPGTELASYMSCISRWVLYHWRHLGSPHLSTCSLQKELMSLQPELNMHKKRERGSTHAPVKCHRSTQVNDGHRFGSRSPLLGLKSATQESPCSVATSCVTWGVWLNFSLAFPKGREQGSVVS